MFILLAAVSSTNFTNLGILWLRAATQITHGGKIQRPHAFLHQAYFIHKKQWAQTAHQMASLIVVCSNSLRKQYC